MQSDGCLRSGNQPPDVDEETALAANAAVLGVYSAFDDVLRVSVNDERRRGRMVATCEGVVGPRDWQRKHACGHGEVVVSDANGGYVQVPKVTEPEVFRQWDHGQRRNDCWVCFPSLQR